MAVESCPSTSPDHLRSIKGISPRISFSHDLSQYDVVPVEPHLPLSPSSLSASASFNFHSHQTLLHSSSSSAAAADELFSNGVLLPFPNPPTAQNPPSAAPPPPCDEPKSVEEQSKNRKPLSAHTSSFWKFRRSRSCNCGSIYTGTLCPLLLPRSKSTGSNSSSKRGLVPKEESNNHHGRSGNGGKQRSLVSGYQKPPLNKSFGSSNGMRVAPVLNVSSGNLFGLGSIFSAIGRGEKSNKKKLGI